MSRFAWLVMVCGLAFTATPAFARDPQPAARKANPTERVLDVLAQEIKLPDGVNISEIPLFELLQSVGKKYEINFTINEESFKAAGRPNVKEDKSTITVTAIRDVTVHQFLTTTLESLGATYLVKNGALEVVPIRYAARVTNSALRDLGADEGFVRLREPLVSVIFKEKPLNEAVAKVAETYDLNVIFLPQAGDAKTGFVTARLLNLPADQALEVLALQCDLRVVRRGTAFVLTSKDHSNELFGEKLDRERQKIELEKLREAPPKPPEPPAPPIPPAPPAPKM